MCAQLQNPPPPSGTGTQGPGTSGTGATLPVNQPVIPLGPAQVAPLPLAPVLGAPMAPPDGQQSPMAPSAGPSLLNPGPFPTSIRDSLTPLIPSIPRHTRDLIPAGFTTQSLRDNAVRLAEDTTGITHSDLNTVQDTIRFIRDLNPTTARTLARNFIGDEVEVPVGAGRIGYRNGFFGDLALPGGGVAYDRAGGLRGHWFQESETGLVSFTGDRQDLRFLASDTTGLVFARIPTAGAFGGDPRLAEFRLRSETLNVDWANRRLDATFASGPLTADLHGSNYRVLFEGDSSRLFLSNRTASLAFADEGIAFSGALDPQHPRFGRADLWLDEIGRMHISNTPESGLFVRTDLAHGNARISSAFSRDQSYAAVVYLDPSQGVAFGGRYLRDAVTGERYTFTLNTSPLGVDLDLRRVDGNDIVSGGFRLTPTDRERFHLISSGTLTNGHLSGNLGFLYRQPYFQTLIGVERTDPRGWSVFFDVGARW